MTAVYVVRTTVRASHERAWRRWQDEEHIPALLALPGYRGVHRFSDLDRACAYLNLWSIDDRRAQQGDRYRAASLTPWFDRIRPFYEVDVTFSGAPEPALPPAAALVVDRWDPASGVALAEVERALTTITGPGVARMAPLVEDGVPAPRAAPSTVVLTALGSPGEAAALAAPPPGVERRRYRALTPR